MVGLIIIAAIVVSVYAAREPQVLKIGIDDGTLYINNRSFPLKEFSSFWIFDRGDHHLLSLYRKSVTRPNLRIIMPSEHSASVRMLLRPSVAEQEHEESLIDLLAERLKF